MNPWTAGYFINEQEGIGWEARLGPIKRGFTLFGKTFFKWHEKQTFIFELNRVTPLTFIQEDGTQIRFCLPGETFTFDFGSIPLFAQGLVRKEAVEFAGHDRCYEVGYVWIKAFKETVWRPVRVTKSEADALLYTWGRCASSPRGRFKGGAIWSAVSSFGWACGYDSVKTLPDPVVMIREMPDVDDPLPMGAG